MADTASVAPEWDALTATLTPLADRVWAQSFARAFGDDAVAHVLVESGRPAAVLPLVKERADRVFTAWGSLESMHSPYWAFAWPEPSRAQADAILDHLLAHADLLFFRRLHRDGAACRALCGAAHARRLPVTLNTRDDGDAIIELAPTWTETLSRLSSNLRGDVPRKQRKLEKLGKLEYRRVTSPAELPPLLAECYRIETLGWKGTSGEPISSRPDTLRFYNDVALGLAAIDRFALYLLLLDGKIIAWEYCLLGGGHIEMLKLSFDPEHGKLSTGNVLRWMLLQDENARGQIHTYHLGRPSEWKMRWATRAQDLCSLRIFAPTLRGRAAHLVPVARGRLKHSPTAQRAYALVQKLRSRNP